MGKSKVKARLLFIGYKELSKGWGGGHDESVAVFRFLIVEGPAAFIDRQVSSEVSMSELVDAMPEEFTERLREYLNELFEAK